MALVEAAKNFNKETATSKTLTQSIQNQNFFLIKKAKK